MFKAISSCFVSSTKLGSKFHIPNILQSPSNFTIIHYNPCPDILSFRAKLSLIMQMNGITDQGELSISQTVLSDQRGRRREELVTFFVYTLLQRYYFTLRKLHYALNCWWHSLIRSDASSMVNLCPFFFHDQHCDSSIDQYEMYRGIIIPKKFPLYCHYHLWHDFRVYDQQRV